MSFLFLEATWAAWISSSSCLKFWKAKWHFPDAVDYLDELAQRLEIRHAKARDPGSPEHEQVSRPMIIMKHRQSEIRQLTKLLGPRFTLNLVTWTLSHPAPWVSLTGCLNFSGKRPYLPYPSRSLSLLLLLISLRTKTPSSTILTFVRLRSAKLRMPAKNTLRTSSSKLKRERSRNRSQTQFGSSSFSTNMLTLRSFMSLLIQIIILMMKRRILMRDSRYWKRTQLGFHEKLAVNF